MPSDTSYYFNLNRIPGTDAWMIEYIRYEMDYTDEGAFLSGTTHILTTEGWYELAPGQPYPADIPMITGKDMRHSSTQTVTEIVNRVSDLLKVSTL
jgi:hypothetical protein